MGRVRVQHGEEELKNSIVAYYKAKEGELDYYGLVEDILKEYGQLSEVDFQNKLTSLFAGVNDPESIEKILKEYDKQGGKK